MAKMSQSQTGKWTALKRSHYSRWYIRLNYTGVSGRRHNPYGAPWPHGVWPKLFKTEAEAWMAAELLPIFANSEATDDRPRIKSASVERTSIAPRIPR